MPVLTVEKPLRDKLGDEAVDSLVRLINQSSEEQRNNILAFVEEKFERRLAEEISALRIDLIKEISDLRSELTSQISEAKAESKTQASSIRAEAAANKSDLIKWMFIFWIGQVAVILGILFTFFKQ